MSKDHAGTTPSNSADAKTSPTLQAASDEKYEEYMAKRNFQMKLAFWLRLVAMWTFTLVAIAIPIAIIYFFSISQPELVPDTGSNLQTVGDTDLEKLLRANDLKGLINYSTILDGELQNSQLPRVLKALEEKIKIADVLIANPNDEEAFRFGVISKLKSYVSQDAANSQFQLGMNDTRENLKSLAASYKDHSDESIEREANYSLVLTSINEYRESGNQEFKKVIQQLDESGAIMVQFGASREALEKFEILLAQSPPEHLREFRKTVAKHFKNSNDPAVRERGFAIHDKAIFQGIVLEEMERFVILEDKSTLEDFKRLIELIDNSPGVGAISIRKALSLLETLNQTRQSTLVDELAGQIKSAVSKMVNSDERGKARLLVGNFETRIRMLREQAQLDIAHEKLESEEPVYAIAILFYSSKNTRSRTWVTTMSKMTFLTNTRFVLICTDLEMDEEVVKKMSKRFPQAANLQPPHIGGILKEFPVDSVPYLVVANRQRRIENAGFDIDYLRNNINRIIENAVNPSTR